jgi:phosphohistidine phosphatase
VKTLLILRHAKAQPDSPYGDWARDLTERGRRNAEAMGRVIEDLVGSPDEIVSSDANRARQTAELAAEAIETEPPVVLEHAIYGAGTDDLLTVVRELPESARTVVIVGHNPGFEDLTAALAGVDGREVHLPTAGLAHLELSIDRWADAGPACGRLRSILTPKELKS